MSTATWILICAGCFLAGACVVMVAAVLAGDWKVKSHRAWDDK